MSLGWCAREELATPLFALPRLLGSTSGTLVGMVRGRLATSLFPSAKFSG